MKITNQIIRNVCFQNDATNIEYYNTIKRVEQSAEMMTNSQIKKSHVMYWSKQDYTLFCSNVKQLIRNAYQVSEF